MPIFHRWLNRLRSSRNCGNGREKLLENWLFDQNFHDDETIMSPIWPFRFSNSPEWCGFAAKHDEEKMVSAKEAIVWEFSISCFWDKQRIFSFLPTFRKSALSRQADVSLSFHLKSKTPCSRVPRYDSANELKHDHQHITLENGTFELSFSNCPIQQL